MSNSNLGANVDIWFNESIYRLILEGLVIVRGDTKDFALPGGKVDPYEHPLRTAYRELYEETKLGKDGKFKQRLC